MRTLRHLRTPGVIIVTTLALLSAASCSSATAPRRSVAEHRALWAAHGLTSYRYDFRQTGFFIICTGPLVRIDVKDGAVDAVTQPATGQPLDVTTCWPTVEDLFDRAEAAEQAGALTRIEYDPTLGYPTVIEEAGLPDASGSYFASNLQPAP